MADLYVNTVTGSSFRWSIQGLGSPFTSANYASAGISTSWFSNGTTSRPSVLTYTTDYTGTYGTYSKTCYHGLSPGSHTLYGFASSGGKYWSAGQITITVPHSDTTPPAISGIWSGAEGWTNLSHIGVGATITDSQSGIKNTHLLFNGVNYPTPDSVSGSTYAWNVPVPPTYGTYRISITARNGADLTTNLTKDIVIGKDTVKPTISWLGVDMASNGIKVGVTAGDDKSGVKNIIYRISPPSVSQPAESAFSYKKTMPANSNEFIYENDGAGSPFINGNTYWIQATAEDNAGNFSEPKTYKSIRYVSAKPNSWVWSQNELNAFNKVPGYGVKTLTYSRWNEFVRKVEEFDKWKNGVNAGKYYLDQAIMPGGSVAGKTLTAYRFNTVRFAIGSMKSGGSGVDEKEIETGKPVLGKYFITLANSLNAIERTNALGTYEQLYNYDLLHYEALIENLNRENRRD